MGFTKLDAGIVDSSIWSADYPTRIVWITFLAKANHQGFVGASRSGMVRSCNVTAEEFAEAEKTLGSPDEDSRSLEHGGKRIQKVEGGWIILNYKKYRNYSYSSSPEAIRQRKHREKDDDNDDVTICDMSRSGRDTSASVSNTLLESISLDTKGECEGGPIDERFKEFWDIYPREGRHAKQACRKKFGAIVKQGKLPDLIKATSGYLDFLKHQRLNEHFEQRAMYALTFLNGRWVDFIDFVFEPHL
jgi:hypothetical protein